MTTTPDPITTAREALYALVADSYHKDTDDIQDITAALDYAEKLKAERDAAIKMQGVAAKDWRSIIEAVLPKAPMCRDCADEDGTCPHNDRLPCDPTEEVIERFRRLTSRLEQAEKVMEYAGDVRWLELAQGSPFTTIDRHMLREMHSRASQWYKDHQAKGEAS